LLTFFGIGPTRTLSASAYEQAIVRFQNDLAGSKPPGFQLPATEHEYAATERKVTELTRL
jgi:hypothetical protein